MSDDATTASPVPPDRLATAYRNHYKLVRYIVRRKFRVPDDDVDNVAQEVFVAFIRYHLTIADDRAWLVATACNAARRYWKGAARDSELRNRPASFPATIEDASSRIDAAALFARLPERCRDLLRLRFMDGYSPTELAARFDTTVGYAKVMLHRCMVAARALLHRRRGT